ncbi:MAG: type II secretion system protein [bacterium]|nr:type II secretion system protein [bacterium]
MTWYAGYVIKRGFTLVEILVVMGLTTILISFSTISILGLQQRTQVNSKFNMLVTDFRSQQIKAMNGEADSSGNIIARGIHFDADKYVLFRGLVYNAADQSNFPVLLDDEQFVNISFPNNNIVFYPGSGEPVNFVIGSDKVTLQQNGGGIQKTITINKYGTIVSDN